MTTAWNPKEEPYIVRVLRPGPHGGHYTSAGRFANLEDAVAHVQDRRRHYTAGTGKRRVILDKAKNPTETSVSGWKEIHVK